MEKTLIKGLVVLEALSQKRRPSGVTELANELRISKSNAHRLLNTLAQAGYVRVDDGRYAATLKIWELGSRIIAQYDVRRFARPVMAQLMRDTSETVRLTLLDATRLEVVYIDRIESQQAVRTFTEVGGRKPAHCSSSGKLLLAYQGAECIKRACRSLRRYTANTITDPEEFARQLQLARKNGYAFNLGEHSAQVRAVAAPIFGSDGHPIAALSIAAPAERLNMTALRRFAPLICAAAMEATASMREMLVDVDTSAERDQGEKALKGARAPAGARERRSPTKRGQTGVI